MSLIIRIHLGGDFAPLHRNMQLCVNSSQLSCNPPKGAFSLGVIKRDHFNSVDSATLGAVTALPLGKLKDVPCQSHSTPEIRSKTYNLLKANKAEDRNIRSEDTNFNNF